MKNPQADEREELKRAWDKALRHVYDRGAIVRHVMPEDMVIRDRRRGISDADPDISAKASQEEKRPRRASAGKVMVEVDEAKEKGNAFEEYVANQLKFAGVRILEWNQGTLTSKGAMGEDALNPDFFIEQKEGRLQYWLECKWRSRITTFMFQEKQIERYREKQRKSRRKVFFVFGRGGEPGKPSGVYLLPLDDISGNTISFEEMKPYYFPDISGKLCESMKRYFDEKVFKKSIPR